MDDLYGLVPVNGTAATVTSQKGRTDGELTDEQKRDNLLAMVAKWQEQIAKLPKGSPKRKELGRKISDTNLEISALKKHRYKGDLSFHILDIVKESMPRAQWNRLVEEAVERAKASASEHSP